MYLYLDFFAITKSITYFSISDLIHAKVLKVLAGTRFPEYL